MSAEYYQSRFHFGVKCYLLNENSEWSTALLYCIQADGLELMCSWKRGPCVLNGWEPFI